MVLLSDIILILTFSVAIIVITTNLKLPPLIGFLLTGIIIGPSVLNLVSSLEGIEILAEIGIMLLMFTIGLEFSLEKIKLMKKNFLFFGGFQVGISLIIFSILLFLFGLSFPQSFFGGFILTLSSTAIILKSLKDKGTVNTPSGMKMTGILLFQDAALIPFLILMPSIVNFKGTFSSDILVDITVSIIGITALLLIGRFLLPKLFTLILDFRLPELFMVAVFVIIFGIAFIAHALGASLAMGAFIAGVALSDTDHAHHVNTELIPSRHLFNSIFFISIGMFVDVSFFTSNAFAIVSFTFAIVIIKAIIIFSIFYFSKHSKSEGIITAFGLAHIGEFSFILLKLSQSSNLYTDYFYQIFLSSAVLSMFFIPLIYLLGEKFAHKNRFKTKIIDKTPTIEKLVNHTIIAGFGVNGQNIARTLKLIGVPFNIIEANPTTVKVFKEQNFPIHYGELDRKENLISMGLNNASLLVIAISDIDGAKRAIKLAKSIRKDIKIIVRANYHSQVEPLYRLGADLVLSQDLETSLTFLFNILKFYKLPDHLIRIQTNLLRKEHYKFFSNTANDKNWKITSFGELEKDNEMFFVSTDSKLIGKTILKLPVIQDEVIKIIGVIRDDIVHTEGINSYVLQQYDTLIFYGNHSNIQMAIDWFESQN